MAAKQLDGHPGDRIGDLRTNLGMTKRELSQKTGIDASQITRIENGTLKTISSDYLIKLAKELKTSTDYILGLTSVSVPKSYDITELGLSNEAVKGLVAGTIDVGILNRLLGHKSFPRLIHLIRVYFQDTAARGIMTRNQLIELATASLSDLMKEHLEHRADARQDLQFLNAQKMGEHEAEIEKIKNVFLAILRDIKKDMGSGELPREVATAAMLQTTRDTLAEQQREPVTMDDVAGMVVGQLGQFVPMDEETAEQFRQLAKKMMEQAGGTQNAEKP